MGLILGRRNAWRHSLRFVGRGRSAGRGGLPVRAQTEGADPDTGFQTKKKLHFSFQANIAGPGAGGQREKRPLTPAVSSLQKLARSFAIHPTLRFLRARSCFWLPSRPFLRGSASNSTSRFAPLHATALSVTLKLCSPHEDRRHPRSRGDSRPHRGLPPERPPTRPPRTRRGTTPPHRRKLRARNARLAPHPAGLGPHAQLEPPPYRRHRSHQRAPRPHRGTLRPPRRPDVPARSGPPLRRGTQQAHRPPGLPRALPPLPAPSVSRSGPWPKSAPKPISSTPSPPPSRAPTSSTASTAGPPSPVRPMAMPPPSLSFGLIWLTYLRTRERRVAVEGLALYIPAGQERAAALRVLCLDPASARFELFTYTHDDITAARRSARLRQSRYAPRTLPPSRAQHRRTLAADRRPARRGAHSQARWTHQPARARHRVRRTLRPRPALRTERSAAPPASIMRRKSRAWPKNSTAPARPAPIPRHPLYRQYPEAWLESQARAEIETLDATLRRDPIYGQVPAFAGGERGILDLLAVDHTGRLTVVELKASADLHLPLQALDYWVRVKWHLDRARVFRQRLFPRHRTAPRPAAPAAGIAFARISSHHGDPIELFRTCHRSGANRPGGRMA